MAKKKTNPKPVKAVPFEQSLEHLREVVGELEAGNLTLGESIEKYEQGIACLKSCYETLNQAQRKIELLVDLDEEGNLATRPFDDTASDQMTQGTRRSTSKPLEKDVEDEYEDEEPGEDDDFEEIDDPDSLF